MTAIHRFSFPTTIHFGPGARRLIAEHLRGHGLQRPLLVTDRGVALLPWFRELKTELGRAGLAVATFSGVWGNPVKSQVELGAAEFRSHQADSIVGIGGGAALDVAKAVALMIHHPGELFDYEDGRAGARPIDQPIPHWVAVPTTAGTGSEVGRSSVISDETTHVKKIFFSPRLLAQAVFADPELTLALPAPLTAATGMDALTHNVEAYLASGFHPICDGIALEGLRHAARALVRAVKDGSDLEARSEMMLSSMMGAVAFQKGLGVTHSCAHALSAVLDLHHGLANGILIDHALAFNAAAAPERFRALAQAAGCEEHSPEAFLSWLRHVKREIGIPQTLAEAGVPVGAQQLEALVTLALADGCHQSNPVACDERAIRRIFDQAMGLPRQARAEAQLSA